MANPNNTLEITRITIHTDKINDPIKIVHISDLHGKEFGENNCELLEMIQQQSPDFVCFTGDLIDKRRKILEGGIRFLKELNKLTVLYYVAGNHEFQSGLSRQVYGALAEDGIKRMKGDIEVFCKDTTRINIMGLAEIESKESAVFGAIKEFEKAKGYKILLSHFPHKFKKYKNRNIDLMLSGHAHGGQVILPFIGGLYSPGQGIFPKYYRGMHEENSVKLIVTRGLGNSGFPLRVFNRPEIIVIELMPE